MANDGYLLAGGAAELERLQLQSRVWAPAGRALLDEIGPLDGARVLEVGFGVLGWLEILADAVGPRGEVWGIDVDERFLSVVRAALGRDNVHLRRDDLFASALPERSFDLVHARFEIAPLGRADEQLAAYRRLLKPGGLLVLEDPDTASWRVYPRGDATRALVEAILQAFARRGGDFDAGRGEPGLLRRSGLTPSVRAAIVALEPGHPYLRLPLQLATSLAAPLGEILGEAERDRRVRACEAELADPETWGTTFTLIQTWARVT